MARMAATRGTDGERPRRGLGGRLAFWTGVALMLVGVVLLGYVGWQFWGTNWRPKREQREGHPLAADAVGGRAAPGSQPKYVPKGEASALIRIPAFGKKYVVPVLEGTSRRRARARVSGTSRTAPTRARSATTRWPPTG